GKAIHASDIQHFFHNQAKFDVFDLLDPILLGDENRTYQILMQLKKDEVAPNLILWAIVKELELLKKLLEIGDIGQGLADLRVWPKRHPAFKKAFARLSSHFINQCLLAAYLTN